MPEKIWFMAMRKTLVILVVGLTPELVGEYTPNLKNLSDRGELRSLQTVLPAVTCTVQSTLLTGQPPSGHGAGSRAKENCKTFTCSRRSCFFFWFSSRCERKELFWPKIFQQPCLAKANFRQSFVSEISLTVLFCSLAVRAQKASNPHTLSSV